MKEKLKYLFVIILGVWLLVSAILVTIVTFHNPVARATISMGWGLIIFWILLAGSLMYRFRDRVKNFVLKLSIDWKVKFVLFATILALVEEAITVTMTNAAPIFGVKVGEAYITASANYLDVVLFHSVIAFIPLFIGWAWVLSRYNFSPFTVFLLFGITGTIAEAGYGGLQHLTEFGLWIFVYGLMVYLPTYSIPENRGTRVIKIWHYVLAIPYTVLVAAPFHIVIGLVNSVLLHHPKIHF